MDREEIIKLAREVGYPLVEYEGAPYIPPMLEMLLDTVAASQRTWVGLTDEEMQSIAFESADALSAVFVAEAKLKDRNEH